MTQQGVSAAVDPYSVAPDAANPIVESVMRDEVVFCLPSTPADAIAKLMADNNLTEIPVLIDRRPVGYVRAEDILDHLADNDVVLTGSDLATRPPITRILARDLLRTPPLIVDEKQPVRDAIALLHQRDRQMALVTHDDEFPVGMLTATEVAAVAAGLARTLEISTSNAEPSLEDHADA